MSGIMTVIAATPVSEGGGTSPPPPPPSFDPNVHLTGPSSLSGASGSLSGILGSSPIGGTPPYSYVWTKSGSTKISLSSTTVSSPSVVWSGLVLGDNPSGFFGVTVHDSAGLSAAGWAAYDFTRTA